jgi:hypothetical protein
MATQIDDEVRVTLTIPAVAIKASVSPAMDNKYSLGNRSYRWNVVYSANGVKTSSDEKLKNLEVLNSKEEAFFDNLTPLKFTWINEDEKNKTYHFGFGAQSVEKSLVNSGLNPEDYFIVEDGKTKSLSYSDFIALNTWQIQKLKQRVAELEARLSATE